MHPEFDLTARLRRFFPSSLRKKLPQRIGAVEITAAKSRALNRRYRGKDRATNVLTFVYDPRYAEILVCPAVIRKEAKRAGQDYHVQLTAMMVHGMLHSGGVHHERSRSLAKRSEAIEQRIVADFLLMYGRAQHRHST